MFCADLAEEQTYHASLDRPAYCTRPALKQHWGATVSGGSGMSCWGRRRSSSEVRGDFPLSCGVWEGAVPSPQKIF